MQKNLQVMGKSSSCTYVNILILQTQLFQRGAKTLRASSTRIRYPRIDAVAGMIPGRLNFTSSPPEALHAVGLGTEEGRFVDVGSSSLPRALAKDFRDL